MDQKQLLQIKELAAPIVEQEELFLVDIEEKGGNETVIWVYVDSEGDDINVDSCKKISRELEFVMDAHDLVRSSYRLNVSSPGLSRPLSDPRQYGKNRGRTVRIKFKDETGYEKVEGVLVQVTEQDIVVDTDDQSVTIPFGQIVETKVIPKL